MDEIEEPILRSESPIKSNSTIISSNLKENNSQGEAFVRDPDHIVYPYTVEYENETIYIDSKNWRDSNLLKLQIIVAYFVFILTGMAEQAVGTLIPELQNYYKIGDMQTSAIYFAGVSGYFIMALANNYSHHKLGVRGVTIMGATSITFCYLILSFKPPFFLFVTVYLCSGIGMGSLDAGFNTWMGNLEDSNQLLGILHGCYGIGCMISPTLITTLLEKTENPWKWNNYYILLAILASLCLILLAMTFKYETKKKMEYILASKAVENGIELSSFDINSDSEDNNISENYNKLGAVTLLDTLKSKLVWVFSVMLFIYVGAEVAFGQWIVSFMMRIKNYEYNTSSYMASSFWIGLTVGRVGLGFITPWYFSNELMANMFYIGCTFVSNILFLFLSFGNIKSFIFGILFISGIFTGPIFPTIIVTSLNILPLNYHAAGIGFICAFGGGGAAALPFLVGTVSETTKLGLRILPLIVISAYVFLTTGWALITKKYIGSYRKNKL